ncbi:hypothetical protein Tsubulata_006074 [Turnera subulata]|uniref:MMS19 nucleotide excision repair protein n=1 Tax=Turnera subulata TaxID=218843 RepID=A0A9Q0FGK3_9ROSI|nr:hypothetical protein Tsubulata_006074 [Turnera subulata]
MPRSELKAAAAARKPLRDLSNGNQNHNNNGGGGGGAFSKSVNPMPKKKIAAAATEGLVASSRKKMASDNGQRKVRAEEDKVEGGGGGGENECLDRLLLVHSNFSSLAKQIDELVAQAFQLKSVNREGSEEIVSFTNALSDMLSSLKPWVPRFQKAVSHSSTEPENQLGDSLEERTVSAVDEFESIEVESPEPVKTDSLVSPSPLVSWRADCNAEKVRQLFLLTPLPMSKTESSRHPRLSQSAFEKIVSNPIVELQSTVSGDVHDDLLESLPAKPTPFKTFASALDEAEKTHDFGFVSSPKVSKRDQSFVVMTPCLKMSPPKSCVLLEPISESHRKHNSRCRKGTPFPVGMHLQSSDSSDSEDSEDLTLKYPELLGIQQFKMVKKELGASPHWSFSPPKSCVLLELQDEKSPEPLVRDQHLPVNAPVLSQQTNLTESKEYKCCPEIENYGKQESKLTSLRVVESTPLWKEPQSTIRNGKRPGENTLKKELWTKFEAASTRGLRLSVSDLHQTGQKKFLDQLDELTPHIESFVDTSSSPTQQASSLGAIVTLLKKDVVTIESLAREMGMYLTTADDIIRAREALTHLSSKSLDNATVHSLMAFFTDRLADWRALRGALIGCLALLRRKSAGVVTDTDAKRVVEVYLENLQVQSLGKHDRKLCFELLEILLDGHPHAFQSLADDFIYGICEAIDGEQDPECLLLTFHIVELLVQLFPDPYGPIPIYASDLFEILGRYFPIHYTHEKAEDLDVKRDDLSRALMRAFSSTPLFEPFAVPVLLEKLSSSLSSAKVDSLKYLRHCLSTYGADRISKHAKAIWSSLKDAMYSSEEIPGSPFSPESLDGRQENEITIEALSLLEEIILQSNDLFMNIIIGDDEINMVFKNISSYKNYQEVPFQSIQKLHVVGRILNVSAKASVATCNRVFEIFFPRLIEAMGVSTDNESEVGSSNGKFAISKRPYYGSLYLCVELLGACRDLIMGPDDNASQSILANQTCCCLIQRFSTSLCKTFYTFLETTTNESTHISEIYIGVKGLQILATFHGGYALVSKSTCDCILLRFVSIVTMDFDKAGLWRLALKALVRIGSFIHGCNESEKEESYLGIVVEKIVSLLSSDNTDIPSPLKLEAISNIGTSGLKYMLKILLRLQEVICANLAEIYELLNAMMKLMKLVVACCSVESQNVMVNKAYSVLLSGTSLPLKQSLSTIQEVENLCSRDEWILSLFASVIIALRPQTHVPNIRPILHLFMGSLLKGYIDAAQALGSLVNKLDLNSNEMKISGDCTFEEAMDVIFSSNFLSSCENSSPGGHGGMSSESEISITSLCLGTRTGLLQIHAIVGLAWIGKGLLMRGHEKVKDITKVFLECLLSFNRGGASPLEQGLSDNNNEVNVHRSVIKCAADAFQILMSDSDLSLNRQFHAIIRPLYKQRFFSTIAPILQSLIVESDSDFSRSMLYRAFAHVISNTPLIVVLNDSKKLIPILVEGLTLLSKDVLDQDIMYSLLLVLSGILMDKAGQQAVVENAHVLVAISKALDDPKRDVRREAVRCRQAWLVF